MNVWKRISNRVPCTVIAQHMDATLHNTEGVPVDGHSEVSSFKDMMIGRIGPVTHPLSPK